MHCMQMRAKSKNSCANPSNSSRYVVPIVHMSSASPGFDPRAYQGQLYSARRKVDNFPRGREGGVTLVDLQRRFVTHVFRTNL